MHTMLFLQIPVHLSTRKQLADSLIGPASRVECRAAASNSPDRNRFMESSSSEVTVLLRQWGDGHQEALERLLPLVHGELRTLAASYMRRERPNHTLQATALVNEAFLKLVDQRAVRWQNRAHFFGIAAQAMRRILVDHARAHASGKRGEGQSHVPLDEATASTDMPSADLLALDEALTRLARFDPQHGRIVELRFFGGLTMEETAEVLHISPATVGRDWTLAKAWLYAELRRPTP
jgi:RNA polymerase sigma-70 factor, ECF subfamily